MSTTRTAPAPIAFRCEHCLVTAHVPAKYAGRRGKCPTCHESVVVPGMRSKQRSHSSRPRSKSSRPRSGWSPPSARTRPELSPQARRPARRVQQHSCRFCGEVLGREFHECQAEVHEVREDSAAAKLDRVLVEKSQREQAATKQNLMLRLPLYFLLFTAAARTMAALGAFS